MITHPERTNQEAVLNCRGKHKIHVFFFYLASQKEKRLFSHLIFRRTTSISIYNVLRFVPFFQKKRTSICDKRLEKNSFHLWTFARKSSNIDYFLKLSPV